MFLTFELFCHHLCYHQNFFESILIHHEACFYTPQHTMGLPLFAPNNNQGDSFCLTYGIDAMIPVEVEEPLTRRLFFQTQQNKANMRVELDIREEVQEIAAIKEEATRLHASRRYNTKVRPRTFETGDRVW